MILLFIVEFSFYEYIVYILQESREWEWNIPILEVYFPYYDLFYSILFYSIQNRRELNNYDG